MKGHMGRHKEASVLKGFTLIELIVVIAIIGILSGILVPAIVTYIRSAKISRANANARQVYESAQLAVVSYNAKGLDALGDCVFIGEAGSDATSGSISIDMSPNLGDDFEGYYGFYVSGGIAVTYAVWSGETPITEDMVKQYTSDEIEDNYETNRLGAHPML